MSQIEISILKQANPPRKKVLSCSFFVMQGGYRDSSVYKNFLESMITRKSKTLKDFELRVYTDDSGKDFVLDIAKDQDHTSVYHYNCDYFREGQGHTGTFGTLVRFLPLFEEGLEVVWITDIDVQLYVLEPTIMNKMKHYKRDFYINSFVCYDRKPWTQVKYPIVAYKVISFVTFPKQLLTRFVTKLTNGDFSDVIAKINEYNDRKTPNDKFPYGTDELFMNGPLYNYIEKHKIPVYIMKGHPITTFIKYKSKEITPQEIEFIDKFNYTPTKDGFVRLKKLYKRLIPGLLEEMPCLQEVLDKIDHLPPPLKMGWLIEEHMPDVKLIVN
jgi:hypothetical protein